jgi:hypothetical protein
MWRIYNDLMRFMQRMTPEEFFVLAVVAVAIGLLCLRGFGSRSSY